MERQGCPGYASTASQRRQRASTSSHVCIEAKHSGLMGTFCSSIWRQNVEKSSRASLHFSSTSFLPAASHASFCSAGVRVNAGSSSFGAGGLLPEHDGSRQHERHAIAPSVPSARPAIPSFTWRSPPASHSRSSRTSRSASRSTTERERASRRSRTESVASVRRTRSGTDLRRP